MHFLFFSSTLPLFFFFFSMAVEMDQQQSFKHYCRICKKGFGCGRALGGHMRAHGVGDEVGHGDDDDPASDWEDKIAGNSQAGNKRMYALRTKPNRLKSCRSCENCGKEFLSWKSFLEHGKCSLEDVEDESLVSEPAGSDGEDGGGRKRCAGWSKGKRSRRVVKMGNLNSNCPSSEEEDLAHCLVMLSAARVDQPLVGEMEESCASASKEERQRNNNEEAGLIASRPSPADKAKGIARGMFECKACKKVFNSHQALGGHRASHKKVKGCFAAKVDELDESNVEEDVITHEEFSIQPKTGLLPFHQAAHELSMLSSKRKSRVHECSICHRIFASGQALGGHKRCHWVSSNSPDTSIARLHQLQDNTQQLHQIPKFNKSEPLDLNLPAPVDETTGVRHENIQPLNFNAPVSIYLQHWIGLNSKSNNHHNNNNSKDGDDKNHNKSNCNNNNNNVSASMIQVDDEDDSKIKLAKLSDLKDINTSSGSSPWLQVGIGSAAAEGSNDP